MRRHAVVIFIIVAILVTYALRVFHRHRGNSFARSYLVSPAATVPRNTTPFIQHPIGTYPQIDTKWLSRKQIQEEVRRRDAEDRQWEWKIPIRFYGRVVDEKLQPVSDAKVRLQWNDVSSRGTSEFEIASDVTGSFSLTNVQGKGLTVQVSKEGYYKSKDGDQINFEFANPYEKIFYIPNPDAPAIFHLRKKGDGEHLIAKSISVSIPYGEHRQAHIDLLSGRESPAGQLVIDVSKPDTEAARFPYDWQVSVSIPSGGLIEHNDEFPFEAPESGYQSTINYSLHAESGLKGVAFEKKFYFVVDQSKNYGRLNIRTDGHSHHVSIDYALNPSGSRNLEQAKPSGTASN